MAAKKPKKPAVLGNPIINRSAAEIAYGPPEAADEWPQGQADTNPLARALTDTTRRALNRKDNRR